MKYVLNHSRCGICLRNFPHARTQSPNRPRAGRGRGQRAGETRDRAGAGPARCGEAAAAPREHTTATSIQHKHQSSREYLGRAESIEGQDCQLKLHTAERGMHPTFLYQEFLCQGHPGCSSMAPPLFTGISHLKTNILTEARAKHARSLQRS